MEQREFTGGWLSGSCAYGKQEIRRDNFLASHPEWEIVHVKLGGYYEASKGDSDTELAILTDRYLGDLMDRLEEKYGESPDEGTTDI
jgi:hypothetical protein